MAWQCGNSKLGRDIPSYLIGLLMQTGIKHGPYLSHLYRLKDGSKTAPQVATVGDITAIMGV